MSLIAHYEYYSCYDSQQRFKIEHDAGLPSCGEESFNRKEAQESQSVTAVGIIDDLSIQKKNQHTPERERNMVGFITEDNAGFPYPVAKLKVGTFPNNKHCRLGQLRLFMVPGSYW